MGALRLLGSDRTLAGLSLASFFAQLAHVVLPSVFVLYATYRYGWDAKTVGLTFALVGICSMVVQGGAIGPIVQRFGERRALFLGLACGAGGLLIFGAAPSGPLFWIGIPSFAVGRCRRSYAGARHAIGVAGAARSVAGRDRECREHRAITRTVPVHADVCVFHR